MYRPLHNESIVQSGRWLHAVNATNPAVLIPPFAVVVPTGGDQVGVHQVSQATTYGQWAWINSGSAIQAYNGGGSSSGSGSSPGDGIVTRDSPMYALYDPTTGTPVPGAIWGAQAGSWALGLGQSGFRIVGLPDTTNNIVEVEVISADGCIPPATWFPGSPLGDTTWHWAVNGGAILDQLELYLSEFGNGGWIVDFTNNGLATGNYGATFPIMVSVNPPGSGSASDSENVSGDSIWVWAYAVNAANPTTNDPGSIYNTLGLVQFTATDLSAENEYYCGLTLNWYFTACAGITTIGLVCQATGGTYSGVLIDVFTYSSAALGQLQYIGPYCGDGCSEVSSSSSGSSGQNCPNSGSIVVDFTSFPINCITIAAMYTLNWNGTNFSYTNSSGGSSGIYISSLVFICNNNGTGALSVTITCMLSSDTFTISVGGTVSPLSMTGSGSDSGLCCPGTWSVTVSA